MTTLHELNSLAGRVGVITGGAGHLGKAMAQALVELGATIVLVDRDRETVDACAQEIGGRCCGFQTDLEQDASRRKLADHISERFGHIDILINNAAFVGTSGLGGWAVPFVDQSIDTWRRALEVNLTAPFHLAQLFHPLMATSGNGSIINIGSIYGLLGPDWSMYDGTSMGNPAAYAASKGGLIQLTRWLSTTLAPQIRVNSVSPGGIERGQPPSFVDKYKERTPLARMGREEDFMGVIGFLASDASAWVTGQDFTIDGGWSAW
jgi:NAD(P)-dependent dehydrogenase (short-subunit alcohol dehydrogenase family)